MLHRGPGSIGGCRKLLFSNGGRRLPRPTGVAVVIEITIRVRFVQKAVEITEVVARLAEAPQFPPRAAGAKRPSRQADLACMVEEQE